MGDRARGAGRQRRAGPGRRARRLHPHAGGLARDHHGQRRPLDGLRSGRRDRGDAVAQPAERRRVQVQPAARRAGRHGRDRGDRGARQRADPQRSGGREADPVRARPRRRGLLRLPGCLRRRPPVRGRPGRDQGGGGPHRRRPARRRVRALLGRDRRPARARADRGQPAGRRDLAVHDPRLGRQDPDGLLVPLGDGVARGAEGRVRRGDRQRRRRRPARHRHPGRRADEPEPLPRRRDPVPVRRRRVPAGRRVRGSARRWCRAR